MKILAILLAGVIACPASAAVIGYEITYRIDDLAITRDGNFLSARDHDFWGIAGLPGPEEITIRVEASQNPVEMQTYNVEQTGVHVGTIRNQEIERFDILLDSALVVSDTAPPLTNNNIFVSDAFPIAQSRNDLFQIGYQNDLSLGTMSLGRVVFSFSAAQIEDQDTWLSGVDLPSESQLTTLARAPSFRADFTDPLGESYSWRSVFSQDPSLRPRITAIEVTSVPLPAGLPLMMTGIAGLFFVRRLIADI